MCARYTLTETTEAVETLFGLESLDPFPPRYNIAPTQPILMMTASGVSDIAPILVRWGFVPNWVKEPGEFSLLLNARSETAAEKPSFRNAMRHRRTLVPASGYYEWHRQGDAKQAYLIRPRNGGILTFGGLMETWSSPNGSEIDSGCILTTGSNQSLSSIHHRMPVIIRPEDFDRWLNCRTQEPRHVEELMLPFDDDFLECVPIGKAVNTVTNSGPEIQNPVEIDEESVQKDKEPKPDQMDLF
ncbi:MAG: SOS response-associated peptidase [Rhizobiaceae bacterium]|nr:SOS response-associated peptidase [Rhizobiaceae bacterium]